jgi:hypothetical protein
MNTEERLNHVADRYRSQGFDVVVRPGPEVLPPFAKDFKVEILATSEKGNVLASAKASPAALEADPNVPRYAEVTEKQPGWRFDVLVLGPDQQAVPVKVPPKDLDEVAIREHLDFVEQMLRSDAGRYRNSVANMAFVSAWAGLEAAMRRRLEAEGEDAGWGTAPRTMLNELYSSGAISTGVFRELEGMFTLRNAIVHGFSAPVVVDDDLVLKLVAVARRLLAESKPTKQTA